jgi:NAD(P)-dependent dehydrogenase (short-subunit alcohol dehydrogenase family)
MRTPSVLVTGASGEIGHGLINQLARTGRSIVTVDIAPLDEYAAIGTSCAPVPRPRTRSTRKTR